MIEPARWPGAVPPLGAGGVQLWRVDLDTDPDSEVLDEDERGRAARFVRQDLAHRWINARAALRRVLAVHAGVDASELRIERAPCVHCGEPHGKPFLAWPAGTDLRFNLSHSAAVALIAVARGREVGVDVEEMRPGRRTEAIAGRWFTPAETDHLRGADDAVFYRLWARKEAYLKGTAEGMRGGLASIDALRLDGAPGWDFADVDAGSGYAGAVAVAPPGYRPGG